MNNINKQNINNQEDINDKSKYTIASFAIFIYIIFVAYHVYSSGKKKQFIDLISNNRYMIHLFIIFAFTYYICKMNGYGILSEHKDHINLNKLKEACKKAIFGYIIAVLAYFHITLAAYWAIFIVAYFFDGFI